MEQCQPDPARTPTEERKRRGEGKGKERKRKGDLAPSDQATKEGTQEHEERSQRRSTKSGRAVPNVRSCPTLSRAATSKPAYSKPARARQPVQDSPWEGSTTA